MASKHSCCTKYIAVQLSMIMTQLRKLNAYLLPSFVFICIFIFEEQIIRTEIQKSGFTTLEPLAALLPLGYVMLLGYLLFASLSFKVEKISKEKTTYDKLHNTNRYFFLSGVLGVYFVLMFAIALGFIIKEFLVKSEQDFPDEYLLIEVFKYNTDEQNYDNSLLRWSSKIVNWIVYINLGCFTLIVLMHSFTHINVICEVLSSLPHYIFHSASYVQKKDKRWGKLQILFFVSKYIVYLIVFFCNNNNNNKKSDLFCLNIT